MVHHEHEWHVREDNSALLYEDGAVHICEDCEYVEVTDSYTSERHDETFYEEGYNCDATRRYRFDLTAIQRLHGMSDAHESIETLCDGREAIAELYDANPTLVEEIEQRAAERLCDDTDHPPEAFDWMGRHHVYPDTYHTTVEYGGDEYRLTYEHVNTTVDEL